MIASKFLISTAAAAAVVGAIGMAYAQTTTPPVSGTTTGSTALQPSQPVPTPPNAPTGSTPSAPMSSTTTTPSTMPSAPMPTPMNSSTPSSGSTDTSTMPTERAVRADRN